MRFEAVTFNVRRRRVCNGDSSYSHFSLKLETVRTWHSDDGVCEGCLLMVFRTFQLNRCCFRQTIIKKRLHVAHTSWVQTPHQWPSQHFPSTRWILHFLATQCGGLAGCWKGCDFKEVIKVNSVSKSYIAKKKPKLRLFLKKLKIVSASPSWTSCLYWMCVMSAGHTRCYYSLHVIICWNSCQFTNNEAVSKGDGETKWKRLIFPVKCSLVRAEITNIRMINDQKWKDFQLLVAVHTW